MPIHSCTSKYRSYSGTVYPGMCTFVVTLAQAKLAQRMSSNIFSHPIGFILNPENHDNYQH